MGATAGLLLALPASAIKGGKPTIGGAACYAGLGLLTGAAVSTIAAAVQLAKMDKAQIVDRADAIMRDDQQAKRNCVAVAGAGTGLIYGATRLMKIAKDEDKVFAGVLFSRRGAWLSLAYAALGMGIVYGSFRAVQAGVKAVKGAQNKHVDDEGEELVGAVSDAINGAKALAGATPTTEPADSTKDATVDEDSAPKKAD